MTADLEGVRLHLRGGAALLCDKSVARGTGEPFAGIAVQPEIVGALCQPVKAVIGEVDAL